MHFVQKRVQIRAVLQVSKQATCFLLSQTVLLWSRNALTWHLLNRDNNKHFANECDRLNSRCALVAFTVRRLMTLAGTETVQMTEELKSASVGPAQIVLIRHGNKIDETKTKKHHGHTDSAAASTSGSIVLDKAWQVHFPVARLILCCPNSAWIHWVLLGPDGSRTGFRSRSHHSSSSKSSRTRFSRRGIPEAAIGKSTFSKIFTISRAGLGKRFAFLPRKTT